MERYAVLAPDLISLATLLLLVWLLTKNDIVSKEKTANFIITIVLTITVVISEFVSVLVTDASPTSVTVSWAVNLTGFIVSPFIPISMAFLYCPELLKRKWLLLSPMLLNAALFAVTPFTGLMFTIDAANTYHRGGRIFYIYTAICVFGLIVLLAATYTSSRRYSGSDRVFIAALFVLVAVGTAVQVVFPKVLILWGSVTAALVLYYVFLRELHFSYDSLTGVLNRQYFQNRISKLPLKVGTAIIVFDLYRLKYINDTFGHISGDEFLKITGEIITDTFGKIGYCYRIGGDEFCVVAVSADEKTILEASRRLESSIRQVKARTDNNIFDITMGYSFYCGEDKNIYDIFNRADAEMYKNKVKRLQQEPRQN